MEVKMLFQMRLHPDLRIRIKDGVLEIEPDNHEAARELLAAAMRFISGTGASLVFGTMSSSGPQRKICRRSCGKANERDLRHPWLWP